MQKQDMNKSTFLNDWPAAKKEDRSNDLLTCPFCGNTASFGTIKFADKSDIAKMNGQSIYHYVVCQLCGSNNRGIVGYKTQSEAKEHWNTRTR